MQKNVGRETTPERLLRNALYRKGLRFEIDARPVQNLKITADIVFPVQKACVFIDGCFWHGCLLHFQVPKTNAEWWREKIENNKKRDSQQTKVLQNRGWTVLRFWEHEIISGDLEPVCTKILSSLELEENRIICL